MTIATAIPRNRSKAERATLKAARNKERSEANKLRNAKVAAEKAAKAEARAAKRNPPVLTDEERQEAALAYFQAQSAKKIAQELRDERRATNRAKQLAHQLENKAKGIATGKKRPAQPQGKPSAKTAVRFVAPVLTNEQLAAKGATRQESIVKNRAARIAFEQAKLDARQFRLNRSRQKLQLAQAA